VRLICLAALIAATYAWAVAAAPGGVRVGLLACTLAQQADAPADGSARQALCAFRPKKGAPETYVGSVQGVKSSASVTLLWRVTLPPAMSVAPGFLEQHYAADPRTPAEHMPDLVGLTNSSVVLESMADKKVGSASSKNRSLAKSIAVLRIELKLKSTTG
jgi:uncharacterized protein DUF992